MPKIGGGKPAPIGSAVLARADYDAAYYGIEDVDMHPAGYSDYSRTSIIDSDTGMELTKGMHHRIYTTYQSWLTGGKVLSVGCALGFDVEDMRSFGVDCYGVDWSDYLTPFIDKSLTPYITIEDAITHLQGVPDDHYKCIFGLRFLPCLSTRNAATFMTLANSKSQHQFYLVDDTDVYTSEDRAALGQYYNIKAKSEWQTAAGGKPIHSMAEDAWRIK